jgi:hypothetical protein
MAKQHNKALGQNGRAANTSKAARQSNNNTSGSTHDQPRVGGANTSFDMNGSK